MKSRLKALILAAFTLSFVSGINAQTTLFTEDFEGATLGVTSSSSSGTNNNAWALNTNLQSGGLRSDSAQVKLNDSLFLESSAFSTVGFANVSLRFDQICKIDFFDRGIVQFSTNNGSSWTSLGSTDYTGTGTMVNNSFSSVSYLVWDPINITTIPTNSWWRSEGFDMSAAANNAQVKVRFVLIDADNNGAVSNYGWLVDDIQVVGAPCELIPPAITLSPTVYQGSISFQGPYPINASITDASGVASARITYTLNGVVQTPVNMSNVGGNDWRGTLPAAQIGDTVCYRIEATDNTTCGNVGYLPSANGCTEFDVISNPPPPCVGTTVTSYPYLETFATFTPGNGSSTVGTLRNSWVNDNTDTHDWWVLDRATGSFGTGPTADNSPGDANYLYVESSGSFSNTTAIINTPCYDLSGLTSPKLEFYYHMYDQFRNNMGDLHLDVYFGGQWVLDIMPVISGDQGQSWNLRLVDLAPYAGNTIKLRFRADVGSGFRSDIAIDDITIFEPLAEDVGISGVFSPSANACTGSANQFITLELTNFGSQTQDTIPVAYTLNGGGIVRDTAFLTLQELDTVNFTLQQTVNMAAVGTYDFDFWLELPGDLNLTNDTVSNYIINTSALNAVFPDTTNFDNFVEGVPGTLFDGWSNDPSGDNHDWYVESGTTPSANTGPSGDNTTGLGNYMYVEATGFFNTTANLFSKCLDINNLNQPELEFYYHMLGGTMGNLHLDININGIEIQDIMPPISGNQGSNWLLQTVDLTPYKGNVKLIFRAEVGTGFQSDIAIDDVVIIDRMPVSVESKSFEQADLRIYPNPAREMVNVLYTSSSTARLQIFNMNAQIVYEGQLNPNSVEQLDVSAYSAGLYQIRLSNESGLSVEKLVIE